MDRDTFLCILNDGLEGLAAREVDDILADYVAYFDEAHASGRSEQEVAAALGDPRRLARELRAESGLRRWENHRSLGNSAAFSYSVGPLISWSFPNIAVARAQIRQARAGADARIGI